jgi:hypothetical protein
MAISMADDQCNSTHWGCRAQTACRVAPLTIVRHMAVHIAIYAFVRPLASNQ